MNYTEKEAVAALGKAIRDKGNVAPEVDAALTRLVDLANASSQQEPGTARVKPATQDLSSKQGSGVERA